MATREDFMATGAHCVNCGKELNAGGMYPAEVYAGTMTGLCYGCTRAGAFRERDADESGREYWSHPPTYASGLDRRRHFYHRPDCQRCMRGRVIVARDMREGGPYSRQCEYCAAPVIPDGSDRATILLARMTADRAHGAMRQAWLYFVNFTNGEDVERGLAAVRRTLDGLALAEDARAALRYVLRTVDAWQSCLFQDVPMY